MNTSNKSTSHKNKINFRMLTPVKRRFATAWEILGRSFLCLAVTALWNDSVAEDMEWIGISGDNWNEVSKLDVFTNWQPGRDKFPTTETHQVTIRNETLVNITAIEAVPIKAFGGQILNISNGSNVNLGNQKDLSDSSTLTGGVENIGIIEGPTTSPISNFKQFGETTHTVTNMLTIGDFGSYKIFGGTLSTPNIVNNNTFTQSGGTIATTKFTNNLLFEYTAGTFTGSFINNGTINYNTTDIEVFDGNIIGTGKIDKQGAGTLILKGDNSYSGGTTVSAGVLQGNTESLRGDIVNNASIVFEQANIGIFGGKISGTGNLIKQNTGTLILNRKNSYTGYTLVAAGVLQGNTNSLPSNIINNASVVFDQTNNGTYTGNISGSGTLTKKGTGILKLDGNNSFSGGINLNQGTVSANSDSNLGSGALNFDSGILQIIGKTFQSSSKTINFGLGGGGFDIADPNNIFTINQSLGSGGGLLKMGAGTLVLNGNNTYTGGTTVNAGNLQIGDADHPGASIVGPVDIDPAGILSGHGTINGNVNNFGTLSPGGSIGTLNVNGNVTFNPGSTFNVEINPQQASLLNVSGLASLGNANANVSVLADPGTYSPRTYTILNAGAISGRFAGVSITNPTVSPTLELLTPSLKFFPNRVDLALDVVVNPIDPQIDIKVGKNRDRLVSGRLNAPLGINCAENRYGFWARGLGMLSSADASGNAPGYDGDTGGAIMGFDHQFGKYLSLGIAGFTTHTDVTTHQSIGNLSSSDNAGASLYGILTSGAWQFKSVFSYDNSSYSAQRAIPNSISQLRVQSNTHANHLSSYDELSYTFRTGDFSVQPMLGLNLGWLRQNGFSERGGRVGQNLSVDGRTIYTLDTLAGLRVRQELDLTAKLKAQFEVHAIYDHDFSTLKEATSAHFDNGTAGLIKTADRPDQRDAGILGASLSLLTTDSLNFYLDYNAEIRSGQNTHFFNAGIRYAW
jgi:fibronectin-binding autotransporter adhesin